MDSPRIQAITFDAGGTLLEPWPSVGHVYAAVGREAGLTDLSPALLNARFIAAWRNKGQFDYTRESWARLVMATFGGSLEDFGADSPFFEKLYDRFKDADVWRIHDDVTPALRTLANRGLKLAVVSNWDDRLRPLLRNLHLDGYFQAIEVSGESGFHKPSPEIFHRAARALGVPAAAILHVGDDAVEDVQGAREAGLQAVLLRRDGLEGRAGEVGSLEALAGLVGGHDGGSERRKF